MKLLLALFVLAMSGHCKGWSWLPGIPIGQQLADAVNKNRHLATGNAEFSQKVEELYYANKNPDSTHTEAKRQALDGFNGYNRSRQYLENQISKAIDVAKRRLAYPRISRRCRSEYANSIRLLSKFYSFSNEEKSEAIREHGGECIETRPNWGDY